MTDLTLYHYPGACSFVCLVALEQSGLAYELELIDIFSDQQHTPDYLAVNPLGKVPALLTPQGLVTENAAVLTYIHNCAPEAGVFPLADTPYAWARREMGLSFCGGNLHPIVRGLFNPARMTDGNPEGFRSKSKALAAKSFAFAEEQTRATGWWFARWSVMDVYLNWALGVARAANYDLSHYPTLSSLAERLNAQPVFARALDVNAAARAKIAARVTA